MVECDLAKVEVAGSNPVSRSNFRSGARRRLSATASGRAADYKKLSVSFGWQTTRLDSMMVPTSCYARCCCCV